MTRRIRRHKQFELTLELKDEEFIRTPRDSQRNWLLNRALKELGDDLVSLDARAGAFVQGGEPIAMSDRRQAKLQEQEIMEDWQIPIMQKMVDQLPSPGKDILEVGFGRGISSTMLQEKAPKSHAIIECNTHVVSAFESWASAYPDSAITLIEGMWQNVVDQLAEYDGIFFHTYPLDDQEYVEQVAGSVTFAGNFFSVAADHLRSGGVFTYLTNEADSLSRAHQRLLLKHFSSFSLRKVRGLQIPHQSRDAHWSDEMVVVAAVK